LNAKLKRSTLPVRLDIAILLAIHVEAVKLDDIYLGDRGMAFFRRYELALGFLFGVAVSALIAVIYNQSRGQEQSAEHGGANPSSWPIGLS
jgi:hypothetical protein